MISLCSDYDVRSETCKTSSFEKDTFLSCFEPLVLTYGILRRDGVATWNNTMNYCIEFIWVTAFLYPLKMSNMTNLYKRNS